MLLLEHRNFKVLASGSVVASGEAARLANDGQFQQKMTSILNMASQMVPTTVATLSKFEAACRGNPKGAGTDTDVAIVLPALLKYFHIDIDLADESSREKQLDRARRIRSLYQIIGRGLLLSPCDIIVQNLDAATNGRVRLGDSQEGVSTIRRYFGFTDEWGHKPWRPAVGDIELNVDYVKREQPDTVARTVVHEASHKFANTKDVLYKEGSFAKLPGDLFNQAREMGTITAAQQREITRAGRDKPLRPMSAFEPGTDTVIADERWLENADSYAWAARRIWKHKTGFMRGQAA